jgi:predicted Zn-dependent peptidase
MKVTMQSHLSDMVFQMNNPIPKQKPGDVGVWDLHIYGTIQWGCFILGRWDYLAKLLLNFLLNGHGNCSSPQAAPHIESSRIVGKLTAQAQLLYSTFSSKLERLHQFFVLLGRIQSGRCGQVF